MKSGPSCRDVLLAGVILGWAAPMNAAVEGGASPADTSMADPIHIVYIEASTGARWKLAEFPARAGDDRYRIRFLAKYDFDKSQEVSAAVSSDTSRPDAVVLQECSVYFPGPVADYRRLYRGWVDEVRRAGSMPILATVVPPAPPRGFPARFKQFIKERILRREPQIDQVTEFNTWIRGQAEELGAPLLDLEAALRVSADDRHLREEFDSGDGIHVNKAAYAKLDALLLETLRSIPWDR